MKYNNIKEAIFISRPNRFIAEILVDGKLEIAHVKNTGRCKELLIKGCRVLVQEFDTTTRKTKYDLVSVYKGDRLINMDSQAPNKIFHEWVLGGNFLPEIKLIKPEKTYGDSRFDFYIETDNKKIFVEVKGVTLEGDNIVRFPDAPTERGVKHINELCKCIKDGYEAHIVFIIQMEGARYLTPNDATHKAFGDALRKASQSGVNILALDCEVDIDTVTAKNIVKVIL